MGRCNPSHTWNADDMQLRVEDFYQGEATYRKVCNFPEEWKDRRLFLRFEGVGSCARVYVNGVLVGEHRGGYSAFACEIQQEVRFGQDNEITVIADNASRPDVIPVNHFLFGVYGGIYRPVSLIVTDRCNIAVTDHASSGVYITQKDVSRESARITVRTKLDNGGLRTEPLVLESVIEDMEGRQHHRRGGAAVGSEEVRDSGRGGILPQRGALAHVRGLPPSGLARLRQRTHQGAA